MNRWIFYHADCLDGFGAAFAAWKKFGFREAVYRACRYDEGEDPFDMCEPGDEVFVVDFSFKREVIERQSKRVKLKILDHHKTAEADLKGFDFCHFDMSKSGAVLAWEFFNPEMPVPKLIQHIQDRDLWQWKLLGTREINTALASLQQDFHVWDRHLYDTRELLELGRIQVAIEDRLVNDLCVRSGWLEIKGYRVPASNSYHHRSELGHALLERYPEASFSVVFYDFQPEGEKTWKRLYSLRAERGFDVGALAATFGGGGHRNAAGFTLTLGDGTYGHQDIVPVPSGQGPSESDRGDAR